MKARVHDKLDDVREKVRDAVPERGQQPARTAVQTIRERPLPVVAVATFVLGLLVGRRSSRGNS